MCRTLHSCKEVTCDEKDSLFSHSHVVAQVFGNGGYIEGPDDRGEAPLPPGPGEFEVKLYVENVSALAGLQAALEFVGSAGPSDDFNIAAGGTTEFQGHKITLNRLPSIAVFSR